MKTEFVAVLAACLAFTSCGQKEVTAPKPPPPHAGTLPTVGSPQTTPPPPSTAPPPAGAAASVVPNPSAQADMPAFEGKNEAERLTQALRAYGQNPNAPAVTSLDQLVKARLIPSVPVPPPGKKYVIDMKTIEVRLENK